MKSCDRCEISRLSEDILSCVISLTSPKDASCCAPVCSAFNSAASSDIVWEGFIPCDILSRVVEPPPVFASKKELFLYLCNHDVLIDNGNMTFRMERKTGANSYMVRATNIDITWVLDSQYWQRMSFPESRFGEVATLLLVWWLELDFFFNSKGLSSETMYASYLVFKLQDDADGLEVPQKSFVTFGNQESRHIVCLQPEDDDMATSENMRIPKERQDGWMEIELGEFYVNKGNEGDVHMGLNEIEQLYSKRGLIIEGIEIRPREIDR